MSIFISLSLSNDRNYLFEFIKQFNVIFFAHIMNNRIITVLIKNDFDYQIEIFRKFKLEIIIKLDYENCFEINLNHEYASTNSFKEFE